MKKKSITIARNAKCVGNNCASYNDKHPENPVSLRPIHDAVRKAVKRNNKGQIVADEELRKKLRSLGNLPKPAIVRGIAHHMRGTA